MLPTNELTHFTQGASQFVHFAAQLTHFVVSVVAIFLLVTSPLVVVAMGSSFHLLGDVMHARGMEMFDGYH